MLKTALFLCICAAYLIVAFGLSIFLGAFIGCHENS